VVIHRGWRGVASVGLGALLLLIVIAGCVSSGPGPLSRPEVDQRLLIKAALESVSSRTPQNGTIHVLDRVDPQVVDRMRQAATDFGQNLTDEGPLLGDLTAATKDEIRAGLGPGRAVEFVFDLDEVPRGGPEYFGCKAFTDDSFYVAFAPVRALAVHGDVFFVTVEVSSGCETNWYAVRLGWEPGQPVGGSWKVLDLIEGVGVSV